MTSPSSTLEAVARRDEAAAIAARARAAALRARLPTAVDALRSRFGAKAVWLFGSLAGGDFRLDSDVDLAVDALAPELYFGAVAELSRVLGVDVDLVVLESCPASLRDEVLVRGERLL
jgi:predicted nucleotidyltransferase